MDAAAIGFAVAALAFAGAAIGSAGYALRLSGKLSDQRAVADKQKAIAKEALAKQAEADSRVVRVDFLRKADQKTIKRQKNTIDDLRKLLREHAPDGAAADQFSRMLQKASGEDGHGDEGGEGGDSVSGE
jgi:hypothetical protein